MNIASALLDSWDRQSRIVNAVCSRIDASNCNLKPSEDGEPLTFHLAHIHKVRAYFLTQLDPEKAKSLGDPFKNGWENPIEDLDAIKAMVQESGIAVREAMQVALEGGNEKAGWYDNAVLYLQHMVWHEGWHVGLIFLALRLGGQEPPQDWEEEKVWGEWRTEEW